MQVFNQRWSKMIQGYTAVQLTCCIHKIWINSAKVADLAYDISEDILELYQLEN